MFIDFDGTLAPIVGDPASAAAHPEAERLLALLAERWARVAVVSGRPVSYLTGRLSGAGRTELYGLYGLEQASGESPQPVSHPEGEPWRPLVGEEADRAQREAPPGVGVERKGLSVTLHYRSAPGQAAWVERFAAEAARRSGLAPHRGKMSVELRPPVPVDKGTVLERLSAGLEAVLFAGDDLGDLPAFAVIRGLKRQGVEALGVAAGGGETPPEVLAAADLVVDGPGGVVELLRLLAGE